ncbi:MAG: hypothetical protein HQK89_15160 [Nitrospirae bacterium]|nr:hypothetical protein [Nitrospirota bacterium]
MVSMYMWQQVKALKSTGLSIKEITRHLKLSRTTVRKCLRSNEAPRLKRFVWLSGIRWAIEQCFEEAKTELGMDHYELRKYPGWNHHMLTCMLAHFFLWHLRITLGEKSSVYYAVSA